MNEQDFRKKVLVIPKPSPKQLAFLKAREKHIAYGGARGGGGASERSSSF